MAELDAMRRRLLLAPHFFDKRLARAAISPAGDFNMACRHTAVFPWHWRLSQLHRGQRRAIAP